MNTDKKCLKFEMPKMPKMPKISSGILCPSISIFCVIGEIYG
jgi:hypothetical protein